MFLSKVSILGQNDNQEFDGSKCSSILRFGFLQINWVTEKRDEKEKKTHTNKHSHPIDVWNDSRTRQMQRQNIQLQTQRVLHNWNYNI